MNKKTLFLASGITTLAIVFMTAPAVTHAEALTRSLHLGMRGTDVSTVQTFLAQDSTLYPQGKVTGYFGFLTKSGVSNFQNRNGLAADGYIGKATLSVLNTQIGQGMGANTDAPVINTAQVNVQRNTATVNWNTNENTKGVVYYSTSPLTTYEYENSVSVSGMTAMTDANLRMSQNVYLQNLQANTTYYYMIYTTDASGIVSVTWPSTFQTTN